MTLEEQIDRSLAYFTNPRHESSFELLPGEGCVMVSAPHAVLQTRCGNLKWAERYTGMLCQLLHSRLNCPVIYKTRHLGDDANHDPVSGYRDAVCDHARRHGLRFLLDLHQLAPERPMDLCVCTGKGRHLMGDTRLVETVGDCFRRQGILRITADDPFDASSPHTVSATASARCGIPSVQLELNTRLLMKESEAYCFVRVLDALAELVGVLNTQRVSGVG